MRKLFAILPAFVVLAGCVTVDFTAPLEGKFDNAGLAFKAFEVIGAVSVTSTETHKIGPLGIVTSVEGAKVTYFDLIQEAAQMGADDIIGVRIDMNTLVKTRRMQVFTHTGQALAIRYVSGREGDGRLPLRSFSR